MQREELAEQFCKAYVIQAEAFRDFASKFPDKNFLSIFDKWAESKDIFGIDKQEIWKIARTLKPKKCKVIQEGSSEFVRLSEVLNILFEADMNRLGKMIEEGDKNVDKTQ